MSLSLNFSLNWEVVINKIVVQNRIAPRTANYGANTRNKNHPAVTSIFISNALSISYKYNYI